MKSHVPRYHLKSRNRIWRNVQGRVFGNISEKVWDGALDFFKDGLPYKKSKKKKNKMINPQ